MASPRALLALTSLLLVAGCETPDDDYPLGHETISVGRARFGEAVDVAIRQWTDEWEFCHPRVGELGPWIDCEETRERAASLTSIECMPAESCRDVVIDGAKGSFFPLKQSFSVKIVGDIEGSRVERTVDVEVEKPETGVQFSPHDVFAETEIALCRFAPEPALSFTVTLDGVAIEAREEPSRRDCLIVRPDRAGTLRAVPRLVDADLELDAVTATVHRVSDARNVTLRDNLCADDGEVGAYVDEDGRFFVSVSASGMLQTSPTSRRSAGLPATRIRLFVGGRVVEPEGDFPSVATFHLDAAPPPGSRVEIDLDGRVETVRLRAKQCD